MGELLAVNVLLEPDADTARKARELNALLLRDLPEGFAFDETHLPHVTLLQRYVRQEDLEGVLAAVAEAAAGAVAEDLRLRAGGLGGGELGTPPGTLLASVEFAPQPEVRALHDAVVRALAPIAVDRSPGAFFTLPGEPPPNEATAAYVEHYVPRRSGEQYAPHLSVGVAREHLLATLADDHALSGTVVTPVAVAVAHLGDLGTARHILRRLPLG